MSTLQNFADRFNLSLEKKGISFSNHGIYTNGSQTFIYCSGKNANPRDFIQAELLMGSEWA